MVSGRDVEKLTISVKMRPSGKFLLTICRGARHTGKWESPRMSLLALKHES